MSIEEDGYLQLIDLTELEEGKMKLVKFHGTPLLIIKQNSQVFVVDNRCPHMACGLSGGHIEETAIVCPCHGLRFNLEDGYDQNGSFQLTVYPVKIEAGKIWIKIEE
ncbi:MAG: Rieske (2Fe-2S) protein [Candidatus Bathyarchaeota archaeon]|nr:Rieske (2Fe-2S) protein [Candidatus Bathyarchaeota archaeon]